MRSNWPLIKLNEIVEHQKGFAFKSKDYIDSGVPVVRVSNFTMDSIDCSDLKFVNNTIANKNVSVTLKTDDVVIATVGSWPTNPDSVVGKTICVPNSVNGSLLNQNAVRLRVKSKDSSDQKFLYYLLKNRPFADYIVSTAQGSANQASITLKDIYGYEFLYPKSSIRKKIANYLESVDKKIELNTQTNQTLEEMAQAIFKSWFVDFDPVKAKMNGEQPKAMDEATASLFPDKLVESELGLIPEGWDVTTLKLLSEKISKGTTPSKKDVATAKDEPSIKFIKVRDINEQGEIDRDSLEEISNSIHVGKLKRSILETNDILFSIAGTIGRVATIDSDLNNVNTNQAVAFIRLKDKEQHLSLIYMSLKANRLQQKALASIVQGVQANLSLANIGDMEMIMPSDDILELWNHQYSSIFKMVKNNFDQSRKLAKLRDTLLPKLLSGEIELDQINQSAKVS